MFPKNSKILIVDDAETIRKIVKAKLETLGYTLFCEAGNGLKAIDQLKENNDINLIICDLNMPQMNGLELLKHIRKDNTWKNLPFIMLTIDNQQEKIVEAVKNQCTQYIVKPLTDKILKEKLELSWKKHHDPFRKPA